MGALILVTNDDGIDSPGLHAAIRAVASLGEVIAVAPKAQQTSMGRALVYGAQGVSIEPVTLRIPGVACTAYAITASPALAVAHALLDLLPRAPDLCVSGINYGENIGATITTSGTVGAALEASAFGVAALAVSLEVAAEISHAGTYVTLAWDAAEHFTHRYAERILHDGLPAGAAVLNVNVPATATADTPARLTQQSSLLHYEWVTPDTREPMGARQLGKRVAAPPSDRWDDRDDVTTFVRDRLVSVTPLSWNLTARLAHPGWLHEL